MSVVLSLYDYTGAALQPWADDGYKCYAFDIQHKGTTTVSSGASFYRGEINYVEADLYDEAVLDEIASTYNDVRFLSAFPPCTDLSAAGARWWSFKFAVNPRFQEQALTAVTNAAKLAEKIGCPYYIENPVGALSRLWRKPDHTFDPFEYGGYLPKADSHPKYPDIIPPRDAYRKRTCLWTGNGFRMPERKPVDYVNVKLNRAKKGKGENFSPVHAKTGGKSQRTKNIRSATPRGFAQAVYSQNRFCPPPVVDAT